MYLGRVRPLVVLPGMPSNRCLHCGARAGSFCSAVHDENLAKLASAASIVCVERGSTFIHEGDQAVSFFNITSGTAKLFKSLPDGRQQITGFAGTGYFLGLAASQTYAFSAYAIEPIQFCLFSRPHLDQLLEDVPELVSQLLGTACSELVAAQDHMLLLGRKTAEERVATFLSLMLHAMPCDNDNQIRLPMTRGDIADYLGLRIETVSRTLGLFKAKGRITTPSNNVIVVLDRNWLSTLAAGDV